MHLKTYIKKKILVLDGATDTMLEELNLKEENSEEGSLSQLHCGLKGENDLLALSHPQVIETIHSRYLDAGADIIRTNTVNSNSLSNCVSMRDSVYEINNRSALLAKQKAREYSTVSKPRFVAGVVGPSRKVSADSNGTREQGKEPDFESLCHSYEMQVRGLADGGVDMFLVDKIDDPYAIKAVICAIEKYVSIISKDVPVMVSVTVNNKGELPSGLSFEDFLNFISEYSIFSIGIKSHFGEKNLKSFLQMISDKTPFYAGYHPGTVNPGRALVNGLSAGAVADEIAEYSRMGLLNISGGCCGLRPDHIKAISDTVESYKPAKVKPNANIAPEAIPKGISIACSTIGKIKKQDMPESRKKESGARRKRKRIPTFALTEARVKRYKPDWEKEKPEKPEFTGVKVFDNYPLEEIRRYIDWTSFFNGWGMKGKYPQILRTEDKGEEARRLLGEANEMLDHIIEKSLVKAKGVVGLFPANSKVDDIIVFEDEEREQVLRVLPMLRQQKAVGGEPWCYCLSDYVAPLRSGLSDYIGAFAATAGLGADKCLDYFNGNGEQYESVMFRFICDRLTEAFAEILHLKVRRELWGYEKGNMPTIEEIQNGRFAGIRPAPGYPTCPDHTLKKPLFELLGGEKKTEISLTSSYAMDPASSVAGFYIGYPKAKYFGVGKIFRDQVKDYAERLGQSIEETERWLRANTNYKAGVK